MASPRVSVTHFTDPGCPWAYSAWPALATLQWRYGDQLEWRHVLIGLTESGRQYEERGYTPIMMARGNGRFRRYGMPFSPAVKDHVAGTSRACRAVVATRLQAPERQLAVLRALQFLQFTTPGLLDEDGDLLEALRQVPGIDAEAIVAAIDSPEVVEAYEADRAEARTAEGTPAHAQDKTARTDGAVRYTAPSLIFEADGRALMAGGFQSLLVYDAMLANLDPALERRGAPADLAELLAAFPDGLVTGEVAQVLAQATGAEPDRTEAEALLLDVVDAGGAVRVPLGDDALWLPPVGVAHGERIAGGRFAAA
jgi:2-hydroxychromene-2-carboxylate isomerase